MPRYEIIAGLDIGTTKVCMAVARKQFGQDQIELLGCYKAWCESLHSGMVVDLPRVADAVSKVLEQGQDEAKHRISTAFVNIAGKHITAENVRGRVNILSKENEISRKDLDAAYNNAKLSAITYDREPLLVVPQDYLVDGQAAIKNPIGLFGTRLEVEYLFITGLTTMIGNLCKAVNMAGLEIEELVLSNLANSFSVLTASEKDIGAILVDLGGSISEVTIFTEGVIRYDKMLPCGSENLSNAIAARLKIQPDIAAKILKNYCKMCTSSPEHADEKILIKEVSPPIALTEAELQKIIEPKIKEILCMIKDQMQASPAASMASSGVVLMGGISTMDGLAELAEGIFNMPVRVGLPRNTLDPSYVTAIGLVEYGSQKRSCTGLARQLSENIFKRAFQLARDFVYDYF